MNLLKALVTGYAVIGVVLFIGSVSPGLFLIAAMTLLAAMIGESVREQLRSRDDEY